MNKTLLLTTLAALLLNHPTAFGQKLPEPLIAHWTFDEKDQPGQLVVKDSGPHRLHGELKHATGEPQAPRVPGRKGNAIEFDGYNGSWVELPTAPILDLPPPFTIAVWIKPGRSTGTSTHYGEIICRKWDSEAGGWRLRFYNTVLAFSLGDVSEQKHVASPPGSVEFDRWSHVAVTHDGKQVCLYVNGKKVAAEDTNIIPVPKINYNPIKPAIGNYVGAKDVYPFIGLIDELMIFGKALTAEELVALGASQIK